jgi:hypothetical protein
VAWVQRHKLSCMDLVERARVGARLVGLLPPDNGS